MLKRIKVRGKLLLLLATPLVAVMVFAYSGIVDRTDFQEGEARIAEFADAGADLSLAVQIERIRLLTIEQAAPPTRTRSPTSGPPPMPSSSAGSGRTTPSVAI